MKQWILLIAGGENNEYMLIISLVLARAPQHFPFISTKACAELKQAFYLCAFPLLSANCKSVLPDLNSWFKKAYRWFYK